MVTMEVGSLAVNFGLGVEDAIRRAIASHEPSASRSPDAPAPTSSWLLSRHAVLAAEGFSSADAWAAIEATWADPDPSAALEWLLLRLPRDRLPVAFASQLSAMKTASVVARGRDERPTASGGGGGQKAEAGEGGREPPKGARREGSGAAPPLERAGGAAKSSGAPSPWPETGEAVESSEAPPPAPAPVRAAPSAPKKDPSVASWILQHLDSSSSSSSASSPRDRSPRASAPSSPTSSSSESSLDDFDPYETPQARAARREAARARRREARLPRAARVAAAVRELQAAMQRAAAAKRAKNDKEKKAAGSEVGRLRGVLAGLCLEGETVDALVREHGAEQGGQGGEAQGTKRDERDDDGGTGTNEEPSGGRSGSQGEGEKGAGTGGDAKGAADAAPGSPRSPSSSQGDAAPSFSLFDDGDAAEAALPAGPTATLAVDPNAPPPSLLEAARRGYAERLAARERAAGAGANGKPAGKKGKKGGGGAGAGAGAPAPALRDLELAAVPPPPCPPADLLRRLWTKATGGTVAFVEVPRGDGRRADGGRDGGGATAALGSPSPARRDGDGVTAALGSTAWRVVLKGVVGRKATAAVGSGGGKQAGKKGRNAQGPNQPSSASALPDLSMLSSRASEAFQKQRKGKRAEGDGEDVDSELQIPPHRSTMTVLSLSEGLGAGRPAGGGKRAAKGEGLGAVPTLFVDGPEEQKNAEEEEANGPEANGACDGASEEGDGAPGATSAARRPSASAFPSSPPIDVPPRDLVALRALFEAFAPKEAAWLSLGRAERAVWFRWVRELSQARDDERRRKEGAEGRVKGAGSGDVAAEADGDASSGGGDDRPAASCASAPPPSPSGPPGLYAAYLAETLAVAGGAARGARGRAAEGAPGPATQGAEGVPSSPAARSPSAGPESDEDAWDASLDRIGGADGAEPRATGKSRSGSAPETSAEARLTASSSSSASSARLLRALVSREASPKGQKWLSYRASLPIWRVASEICRDLASCDGLVVCAETGSGKTTQVPQFILDAAIRGGAGPRTSIVVAQPRRVAATSVARRVAEERGCAVGGEVGYHVRLDRKAGRDTRLLFCTTGVLLRRVQADPDLADVSHVVIDEVHERTIEGDFLLTLLRDLVAKRRRLAQEAGEAEGGAAAGGSSASPGPLKLVLMSATADAEALAGYLSNAGAGSAVTGTHGGPASAAFAAPHPSTGLSPAAPATAAPSIAAPSSFASAPVVRCPGRTFPVTSYFLEDAIEHSGWLPEGQSRMLRGDWDDRSAWESAAAGATGKRRGGAKASIEALVERGEGAARGSAGAVAPTPSSASSGSSPCYSSRTERILSRLNERELDPELVAALVEHLNATLPPDGSILVFLPGVGEIAALVERLDEEREEQGREESAPGAGEEEEWGDEEEGDEDDEDWGEGREGDEVSGGGGKNGEGGCDSEEKMGGIGASKAPAGVGSARPSRASVASPSPLRLLAVPLHSRSPPHAQRRAFARAPRGYRKVVVATNVAETSITIDDVVAVVDTGRLREMRHDPARGLDALELDLCSQASLEQRRGRAGRVRAGVCYTLLTRKTYAHRPRRPVPEMRRAPLQGLVLAAKALSPAPVAALLGRAPDPPTPAAIEAAVQDLCDIGALVAAQEASAGAGAGGRDGDAADARRPHPVATERLTHLGRRLATFPTAPRTGKLLVLGAELGAASAALAVAACLSLRSPLTAQNKGGAGAGAGLPLERTLQSMLAEARRMAGSDAGARRGAAAATEPLRPAAAVPAAAAPSSTSALLAACVACLSGALALRSDPLAAAGALLLALETRRRGGKRAELALCRRYEMRLEDVEELTGIRNQLAGALVASGGVFAGALEERRRAGAGGRGEAPSAYAGAGGRGEAPSARAPAALADSPLAPWNRHASSAPLLAGLLVAAAWPDVAGAQAAEPGAGAGRGRGSRAGGRAGPVPPLIDASGPARPSPSSLCADFGARGGGGASRPDDAADPGAGADSRAVVPSRAGASSMSLRTPFLAYLSKLKTSSTHLASCSPASPAALLLFGADPQIAWASRTVHVGRHVVAAPPARAALLKHLRRALFDVVLERGEASKPQGQDAKARARGSKRRDRGGDADAERGADAGDEGAGDEIADGIVAVLEAEATAGGVGV